MRRLLFRDVVKFCRCSAASAVLLIISSGSALSQIQPSAAGPNSGTTRSIEGTVLDANGAFIPGAIVLLKDTKTLQVRSYIAQNNGRYQFYGLSRDISYQVRAEARGLTSKTKTVSVFDSHSVVRLNLKVTKKLEAAK